jgi:hypothetical protein
VRKPRNTRCWPIGPSNQRLRTDCSLCPESSIPTGWPLTGMMRKGTSDALGTSHPCRHRWTIPDSALTVELSSLRHRAWNFGNAAGRWSRQSARTHCWTLRSVVVDPARRDQSMAFEKARYTLPSWILPDCRTSPLLLGILFGAGFETASQLSALVLAADINPWIFSV